MESSKTFPARFGPFVLLHEIGAGGMGSAYLARHPDVDRLLVVKRLHPELLRDQTIFKRFVHEAEVAAHVRHPHVAAVAAMGTVDGEPFFATEYVFGIAISRLVARIEESVVDPVPLPVGLRLAVDLAAGVEAIHAARHRDTGAPLGLIHRDIGARNALVGFDGCVRLIDLGLGKSELSDWQTAHQVLAGSPDYMPPEQAMGARVDGRADVFSAAVTIWELLAGRKRIQADSIAKRLELAVAAQPEPLLDRRPDATPRIEAILKQAMAPDPDRRTPSAAILRRTLDEERQKLRRQADAAEVARWLDVACATQIARERRLLEDARALERRVLRPVRAETRFFVQETDRLDEDPYQAYAAGAEPTTPRARGALASLADSEAAGALVAIADPVRVRAAPLPVKVAIGLGLLGFMATIAGVTAWLLAPAPPVHVERLPVIDAAPPPVEQAAVPAPAPPIDVEPEVEVEVEVDPDPAPEIEAAPPPRVAPPPPKRRRAPRAASAAVERRKQRLVERVRTLRRQRYEIPFQKKLTRLSTKLSRARSQRALDAIERALDRLEAGG